LLSDPVIPPFLVRPSPVPHPPTPPPLSQTLGSLFVLFAFGLLVAKVVLTGSASNISLKTLECYALVFAARLTSILFYEGYLPYDRSGDWFYQATEVSALVMVVGLIACVAGIFAPTYSRKRDEFVDLIPGFRVPSQLRVVQLALPALVLAVFLHPSLNNNFFTDTAWAFALYLEAVAMLPQVFVFHRMQKVRK
jgi:ER lumen protein retaining receptor